MYKMVTWSRYRTYGYEYSGGIKYVQSPAAFFFGGRGAAAELQWLRPRVPGCWRWKELCWTPWRARFWRCMALREPRCGSDQGWVFWMQGNWVSSARALSWEDVVRLVRSADSVTTSLLFSMFAVSCRAGSGCVSWCSGEAASWWVTTCHPSSATSPDLTSSGVPSAPPKRRRVIVLNMAACCCPRGSGVRNKLL